MQKLRTDPAEFLRIDVFTGEVYNKSGGDSMESIGRTQRSLRLFSAARYVPDSELDRTAVLFISVISFPPVYQPAVIFSDFPETMVFGNTSCCQLFRDAFNNGALSF